MDYDALERLVRLRDQGALSSEEFAAQKRILLDNNSDVAANIPDISDRLPVYSSIHGVKASSFMVALCGSALVALGLFLPIATLPIVGTINLFGGGTNLFALSVLALTILASVLAFRSNERDVIFPGAAIALMLIYKFAMLQWHISDMRSQLEQLKGNPFAGFAEAAADAAQLQWGWLILAGGAAAVIYSGCQARRAEGVGLIECPDGAANKVAVASLVLLLAAPAYEIYQIVGAQPATSAANSAETTGSISSAPLVNAKEAQASREQADYIAKYLTVYDLRARYFDSLLDGRIPGVEFKIKNNGDRTLDEVKVRVVFQDKDGKAIAEEEYYPVLVTSSGIGDNKPLRPNYIWRQESGRFYSAKKVPSEWVPGRATATITDIEFSSPK